MSKHTPTASSDLSTLATDAGALMAATADAAGIKVEEARQHLAAALESGKRMYGRVREKSIRGAKVADQTVRENPYQVVGVALGVGALIGYLISRRRSRNGD